LDVLRVRKMLSNFTFALILLAATSHCQDFEPTFYDVFGDGHYEWVIAFRGTKGLLKGTYDVYTKHQDDFVEQACQEINSVSHTMGSRPYCYHQYRNNEILDDWHDVDQVALVVYKGGNRVAHVIFNGTGSDYLNWFDHNKVVSSSWTDIKGEGANYFSLAGDPVLRRRFFMERNYGGCQNDAGWFVAVDEWIPDHNCAWEDRRMRTHRVPLLLYSNVSTYANWNSNNVDVADDFIVFVRYRMGGGVNVGR